MLAIVKIWKKQPGKYFCITTKSSTKKWEEFWFARNEFHKVASFINENLDKDVYFCPQGFSNRKRTKEFAVPPKLLWADLDAANPEDVVVRPTIAFESSPKRYVGFWETDVVVEEDLNRRLSYSISADISGWDWTQVLRVPNTKNYKYHTMPRVRILWTDGPTYTVEKLEKIVPQIKSKRRDDLEVNYDAGELFRKYEKKMPRWLRKELLNGKPIAGARSEMIWKLQNELIELGLEREEVFTLIWSSPWNKFKERRDGEDQLWRDLDKALDQHFTGRVTKKREGDDEDGDDDAFAFNPLARSMADVTIRNIDWLVPGILARGEVTIIEGDPGLGKSYLAQIVAACICDGKAVPAETKYTPSQGRVAYFDTENTADTVTKLRLIENGCERLDQYFQEESPFTIDDEEKWDTVLEVLEDFKPTLVVFDTINTYIGNADTYKSSETQQALGQFKQIGARFGCAVILLRHLTKNTGSKALYRGQGSIAFTGVARVVLTVGLHPEDQNVRVVACTKNNLGPKPRSFTYTIIGLPDKDGITNRSKLVWGEFVDLTADEIISVAPIKNKSDKETSIKWLTTQLKKGRGQDVKRIEAMAAARGFTLDDLQKAADQLGVKRQQRQGKELWTLMTGDEDPSERETEGRTKVRKSTKRRVVFN